MSHVVVEATYENGVLRPERPLPFKDRERVRVTVESVTAGGHSLWDIRPVSLGKILKPRAADDDLLGEMLEGR